MTYPPRPDPPVSDRPDEPSPSQIGRPPTVPGQFGGQPQGPYGAPGSGQPGSGQPGPGQAGPYPGPPQPPPGYPPQYQAPVQQPAAYPPQFQAAQFQPAPNQTAPNQRAPYQAGPYQSAQYPAPPAPYQGAHAAPTQAPPQGAPYPGGPAQGAPYPGGPGAPGQAAPPPVALPPIPAAAPPVAAPAQPGAYTMTRATAQATAVTGSAATLVGPGQTAEAIAIPDAGVNRPPGSAPDGRRPGPGRGTRALTGRLARLRIGSHSVSRSALAQIKVAAVGAGLILGADRHHAPVSVRIFRPEPTRVTLVGGPWAGRLMAFRAFAVGARVAVITAEPQAWQEFGYRATGQPDRVMVIGAQQPLAMAASAQQPILVIDEFGTAGGTSPQALGPWQTQLTIVRQLDPAGVPLVQDCDLVMLQRLRVEEATVASKALRLPGASTQFLQVMADDMVALVADGADRYISFAQTDVRTRTHRRRPPLTLAAVNAGAPYNRFLLNRVPLQPRCKEVAPRRLRWVALGSSRRVTHRFPQPPIAERSMIGVAARDVTRGVVCRAGTVIAVAAWLSCDCPRHP